jgi:pimeloyl-[acyl-carrier protein] methyl ester esterase
MADHQPKLILLPGMDGTGELFKDLLAKLSGEFETEVVRYPTDRYLSYQQLKELVQISTPASAPYVLVAESFSTPLAVLCTAGRPNLKGLRRIRCKSTKGAFEIYQLTFDANSVQNEAP